MIFDFVDEFMGISVGDHVKVRDACVPPAEPGNVTIPISFIDYLLCNDNVFTVRAIQIVGLDNAMFGVHETTGIADFHQIELCKPKLNKRLINVGSI